MSYGESQRFFRAMDFGASLILTTPNRSPHYDYVKAKRARWAWPTHKVEWTQAGLTAALRCGRFHWLEWVPLYPEDTPSESIYLIVRARSRA